MASLEFKWLEGPFLPAQVIEVNQPHRNGLFPTRIHVQPHSRERQNHLSGRIESFAEWPGIPPLAHMAIDHTEPAAGIQESQPEGAK